MAGVLFKEPARAVSLTGALLPGASLYLFVHESDTPSPAYGDPQLRAELAVPLVADAAARFPPFWLDPDVVYRAQLIDADGAEAWDLDPLEQFPHTLDLLPLDDAGEPMPLSVLTFWRANTTQLQDVFANQALDAPLDNPLAADSDGQFPTIFLDPDLQYRTKFEDRLGRLVFDMDDYFFMPDLSPPFPPVAPVLSGELVTDSEIDLTWTEGEVNDEPAEQYIVLRSVDSGAYSVLTTLAAPALSYADTTVDINNHGYAYKVFGQSTPDFTADSNVVTFGEDGGLVVLYDVMDFPSFPEFGIASSIDVDAANNRIFLTAAPRTEGSYTSHFKAWDIDGNGDISEIFSETIALLPGENTFQTFRTYGALYYPGGDKIHVVRWSGMSTYDYNTSTGAIALSSHYNDLNNYPSGRYGLFCGTVLSPGGVPWLVSSAGRNSFLQAVPVPLSSDTSAPTNTSRETFLNVVARLTGSQTVFYVADSSGNNLTRNTINSSGVITLVDSVATGMATSGLDDGHNVQCAVFDGYVYAQQVDHNSDPILQPTRRWPITDLTTGALGTHEDGLWDFRGNYPYLQTLNNPGGRQCLVHNGHTYFIRRSDGGLHQLIRT